MLKMLKMLIAVLVFSFSFTLPAFAEEKPIDAVRSAQVFGGIDLTSLFGQFSFDRGQSYGGYVNFSFKMKNKKIVYLAKQEGNGLVVLVGENDEPLSGIPENTIGETRNFFLSLQTQNGSAYGYFQTTLLKSGDPILVTLKAGYVRRFISFSGSGGDYVLRTETGQSFGYNQMTGGFDVWVDPMTETWYEVVDRTTGLIIKSDYIDPIQQHTNNSNPSILNIRLEGNVSIVGGNQNYDFQKLDGQLEDGTPAKVFLLTLEGKSVNINAWSQTGIMHIQILRWEAEGEMQEIANYDSYQQYGGYDSVYAYVDTGYSKVIVVVTGYMEEFNINFSN